MCVWAAKGQTVRLSRNRSQRCLSCPCCCCCCRLWCCWQHWLICLSKNIINFPTKAKENRRVAAEDVAASGGRNTDLTVNAQIHECCCWAAVTCSEQWLQSEWVVGFMVPSGQHASFLTVFSNLHTWCQTVWSPQRDICWPRIRPVSLPPVGFL